MATVQDSGYLPDNIGNMPIETPLGILKAAAAELDGRMQGLVQAKIRIFALQDGILVHTFLVVAPYLDHYTYELFRVWHGPLLYPASITALPSNQLEDALARVANATQLTPPQIEVATPQELKAAIRNYMASDKANRIVSGLLAQSKA